MPASGLLVMTSPMLLGHLPAVDTAALVADSPRPHVAAMPPSEPVNLLPLSWSLAEVQDQPSTPPGTGSGADSATDPEAGKDTGDATGQEGENEIVVEGDYGPPRGDPIAEFNETSYRITKELDSAITEPMAYAYRDGLPGPIRDGLGNVVRNLGEPANFLNFLLQGKFGKAFETLGRFAINSSLGIGGLIDVAGTEGIGLPYRRNGFANTLGFYGVDTGAYLYLPITGATTVRDLIGNTLDQAVLPTIVGAPFNTPEYAIPYFIVNGLDQRLEFDEELKRIDETVDPYAARRDTYLYRRERDIALLKGEEPPEPPAILREIEEGLDAIEEDDADTFEQVDEPQANSQVLQLSMRTLPPLPDPARPVIITRPLTR